MLQISERLVDSYQDACPLFGYFSFFIMPIALDMYSEYIEDIYFFEVKTKYMSSSVFRVFMSAQHE